MQYERGRWLIKKDNSEPIEVTSENGGLTLRELTVEDAAELFQLIDSSREHLSQHGEQVSKNFPTLDSVERSITDPAFTLRHRFGIRNADSSLVGVITLSLRSAFERRGEIGYYLGSNHIGKRFASRAVRALTDYAFTHLNYAEIHGVVAKTNVPSMRVLQRSDYTVKHRGESTIVFSKTRPLPKPTVR